MRKIYFLLLPVFLYPQETVTVNGIVVDHKNNPVENVEIAYLRNDTPI